MNNQLLENEWLLEDYVKQTSPTGSIDEIVYSWFRLLQFEGGRKLGNKMIRMFRQGRLKDGMVLTLKDRKAGVIYAGKICFSDEGIQLENFEIYIDRKYVEAS